MNFDDIEILELSHVGMPTKRWVPAEDYVQLGDENETLRTRLAAAENALKFYARAKVLFASFDGSMPEGGKYGVQAMVSFASKTHVKDDGDTARIYFEKYGDKPFEP